MASPKTEKVKKQVCALLEKGPISLHDLCTGINCNSELLTGALQSLQAKGQIFIDTQREKELSSGEAIIIGRAGSAKALDPEQDAAAGQFIALKVAACKKRIAQQIQDRLQGVLADGAPRSEEELYQALELDGVKTREIKPESVPGVIVLPDRRYTLRSTAAGRAELNRREQEARLKAERLQRQKKVLDDLLRTGAAVSLEKLQEILREPLDPELLGDLVLLTGGEYAQPDSMAALEDVANYIALREPLGGKAFFKMFKEHKKLVAGLRKGKEIRPFIVLPDGRVTVEEHPAGQKELQRREMQFIIHRRLVDLIHDQAFFTLAGFSGRQKKIAAQEAAAGGSVWVKYNDQTFWCSPVKNHPRRMAGELETLTGISFPARGNPVTPVVYILENSLKPGETARRLSIHPHQVAGLFESGYLPGFSLEGSLRIWIPPLESIQPGTGLERALKRIEEIGALDVARVLNIPREMVPRLVREGHLTAIPKNGDRRGRRWGQSFRRGQVEDLLGVVSGLKEKWEAAQARKIKGGRRRPKRKRRDLMPAAGGPLVLDHFQEEAIQALDEGKSVLVAAPTGTGKTLIAEKVVEKVLAEGREVIYTSPIKALSNQKFRDFVKLYGRGKVGLITGDVSINERSPLLVMTTEIFRNWCFSNPEWMANISFVIFDEVHYLDDPHRGTAWEESIIFAPPHIKILGLSATVPNINQLAAWMADVRQYPVTVVRENKRAVPLVTKWVTSDGEVLNEREAREEIAFDHDFDDQDLNNANFF